MNCPKCNADLTGTERFCPKCGEAIESKTPEIPSANPQNEISELPVAPQSTPVTPPPQTSEQKNKKANPLVIVLTILCVILGIIACIFAINTFGGKEETTTTAATTTEASKENTYEDIKDFVSSGSPSEFTGMVSPDTMYDSAGVSVVYELIHSSAIRKGPSYNYPEIATATVGTYFRIIGVGYNSGDWVYVYSQQLDKYGWISTTHLDEVYNPNSTAESIYVNGYRVILYDTPRGQYINVGEGHHLNLRSVPGSTSKSSVIVMMPNMSGVRVLGYCASNPSWYYVEYTYHKTYRGFASSKYIPDGSLL